LFETGHKLIIKSFLVLSRKHSNYLCHSSSSLH
jgi:hypothetical protein